MLTQLSTVKTRLAVTVTNYDGIFTNAIKVVSTVSTKKPTAPLPHRNCDEPSR